MPLSKTSRSLIFQIVCATALTLCGRMLADAAPPTDKPVAGDLAAWQEKSVGDWKIVGDVSLPADNPKLLAPRPGSGVLYNGPKGRTRNIFTKKYYADVEAHVEFTVAKGQNSGVYFMGRYEIQLLDSWDSAKDKPREKVFYGDCGGIYQRWRREPAQGKQGFEGHPPRVNVCKRPGEWQSFDVVFRAPRFDADGNKISNAKFVKVVHNGVVIHEDVEVTGPTRAAWKEYGPEEATGPLMLQGDHGSVAYRNILIRPVNTDGMSSDGFPTEVLDNSGFVEIFDGTALDGWHVSAKTGHSRRSGNKTGGRWVVEDGAIVGSQDIPGNGGIVITDNHYGDFEVVLEMKNDFGPDSGLFLRSTETGSAYQYLVDYHANGNIAGLYGEGIRPGFHIRNFSFLDKVTKIRPMNAPRALPIRPEDWPRFWKHGQWNELRARIVGNPPTITTWINGVRFMKWTDPQKRHPDRGGIALQVHGGGDLTKQFVRYRKIRLKELRNPG